jgi:hypothetical protein
MAQLAANYTSTGDNKSAILWAQAAIPFYEQLLKLHPEDEWNKVSYAVLLHLAARDSDAREYIKTLATIRDGRALFNIACLQCTLQDYVAGLRTFRNAIDAGFRNVRELRGFLKDEKNGAASLKGTSEYEQASQIVEEMPSSEP